MIYEATVVCRLDNRKLTEDIRIRIQRMMINSYNSAISMLVDVDSIRILSLHIESPNQNKFIVDN